MKHYLVLSSDQLYKFDIFKTIDAIAERYVHYSKLSPYIAYPIGYATTCLKFLYDYFFTQNVAKFNTGEVSKKEFKRWLTNQFSSSHNHDSTVRDKLHSFGKVLDPGHHGKSKTQEDRNSNPLFSNKKLYSLHRAWNAGCQLDYETKENIRSLEDITRANRDLGLIFISNTNPWHNQYVLEQLKGSVHSIVIPPRQVTYVNSFDEGYNTTNLTTLATSAIKAKVKEGDVICINEDIHLPKIRGIKVITAHYDKAKGQKVGDYYQNLVKERAANPQSMAATYN